MSFSNHFLVALLFLLSIPFAGCKEKINAAEPKNQAYADFSWNKDRIEIYEPVTFTSYSHRASRQQWDLGNGTFSDQPSVTTQFYSAGTYPVKLTIFDEKGQAIEKVRHLKISNRILKNVTVRGISFTDTNGQPWDNDGTGPEVYLYFTGGGTINFEELIKQNAKPGDFPVSTNRFNNRPLTNGPWKIQLKDIDLGSSVLMAEWEFNPIQMGTTDPNGLGSIVLTSGQYEVVLDYQVE